MLIEFAARVCLKASSLLANTAYRLTHQKPPKRKSEPVGEIEPVIELSSGALAMRADLQPRQKPASEKPEPLAGSVEERVMRARGDWPGKQ